MNRARPEDDDMNLKDLDEAEAALRTAATALRADALAGHPGARDLFVDRIGVALSRLTRVWSRISTDGPPQ